jgi:hypothetical protein
MPTRKQRRREAKSKRHEYEFVYVDEEGNELEEPPEELVAEPRARRNGASPAATKKPAAQRGGRGRRTPQPPSWQRAARRSVLLGAVVFVLFSFSSKGHNAYVSALVPALIYTALFIPFTYMIDRFAYRRWQAKEEQAGSSKKR